MHFILLLLVVLIFQLQQANGRNLPFSSKQTASRRTYGNFAPKLTPKFKIFNGFDNIDLPRNGNKEEQLSQSTLIVANEFSVNKEDIHVSSFHTSPHNNVTHYYFHQTHNGVKIVNSAANLNVLGNGPVHSVGGFLFNGQNNEEVNTVTTPQHAIEAFTNLLDLQLPNSYNVLQSNSGQFVIGGLHFAKKSVTFDVAYLQVDNGRTIRLIWDFDVEMENNYYKVCVDAKTNEVLFLMDYISDASYNVLPIGKNDPSDGDREIVLNPQHEVASPLGWHSTGPSDPHTYTLGNNVYAQENHHGGEYIPKRRSSGGDALNFNSSMDLTQDPMTHDYASITQLFYTGNVLHDIFYVYGFNEVAGNFQEYNFELGGAGSDALIVDVQYMAGNQQYNTAAISVLPDGANPRMFMSLWDGFSPLRDVAFDNGVIIHEYMHGVSQRLTGGRHTVSCLNGGESSGMGEGWGDIFAVVFQTNENTTRNDSFEIGAYVNGAGLRKYPYSTNMEINPSTYRLVLEEEYFGAHMKGEIWAVTLYEVYWNLLEKHGFDNVWYNIGPSNWNNLGGNVIFTQLVIDGMKMQPCLPNFIQARDAIIEADRILFNGENYLELWEGFAKRGLGHGAVYPGEENFEVPEVK